MPAMPLKFIQCPDCDGLRVEGRPCRHCEPDDPLLAALRRQERAEPREAHSTRKRHRSLFPRLLGLLWLSR